MLCEKPFIRQPIGVSKKDVFLSDEARLATTPFPCGKCLPCRINRGRIWMHRILLEDMMHESSIFLTLTYNEDTIPKGGTLVPKDSTDFWKRLRHYLHPRTVRYFLVGEYGDESQRPHYHAAVFGLYLEDQEAVEKAWSKGFVMLGSLNKDSAKYMINYAIKGWTWKGCDKLNGRHPEFARMSRNPGLGADAVKKIARGFKWEGQKAIRSLAYGKTSMPLGRYLGEKMSSELGEGGKALLEFYDYQNELFENIGDGEIFVDNLMASMEGKLNKVRGRHKFYRKGRKL